MQTRTNRIRLGMMVLLLGLGGVSLAEDLGTVFSYQGRLETAGSEPLNGSYDFQFRIYDTPIVGTGTAIGELMEEPNVPVTEGIFNVRLDPDPSGTDPNLFNGEVRYLEIAVRKTGSAESYYTISPRQRINAAPYAITASSARWLRGRNSTEKVVYVDDSGNVGVGTTNPTAKLEVNGNIKTAGVYEDGFGNVGIGTRSPSAELEVNGTIVSQNIVYKTADQTIGSGNQPLQNDMHLKFFMKANTTYQFEFNFGINNDVNHFRCRLWGPGTPVNYLAYVQEFLVSPTNGTTYVSDYVIGTRLREYAQDHNYTTSTDYSRHIKIWGTVQNGPDSGNLQLQWTSIDGNISKTVPRGSYVIYREIP
jgi:hypothetical protein